MRGVTYRTAHIHLQCADDGHTAVVGDGVDWAQRLQGDEALHQDCRHGEGAGDETVRRAVKEKASGCRKPFFLWLIVYNKHLRIDEYRDFILVIILIIHVRSVISPGAASILGHSQFRITLLLFQRIRPFFFRVLG